MTSDLRVDIQSLNNNRNKSFDGANPMNFNQVAPRDQVNNQGYVNINDMIN